MKKPYENFEMEIFLFRKEDAVVASAGAPTPVDHDNSYVDYSSLFNSFFES